MTGLLTRFDTGIAWGVEVTGNASIVTLVFAERFAYKKIRCAGYFREQEGAKHKLANAAL